MPKALSEADKKYALEAHAKLEEYKKQLEKYREQYSRDGIDAKEQAHLDEIQAKFDKVFKALQDRTIALEEAEEEEKRYESGLAKLRPSLDKALQGDFKARQEMLKLQDGVRKKKGEMESAAAPERKDYAQALKHLEILTGLVNSFLAETQKTARSSDWVLATSIELLATIQEKYYEAASKLDAAAQAYDDALKEHREAVNSSSRLGEDIFISLFFVGIAGAAGGALGAAIKNSVQKAVKDSAGVGALIDASKDIAKFATKSLQNVGESPGDPLAGLGPLKGNGVELGRMVGMRLKDEAKGLMRVVKQLARRVKDADDKNAEFRIEGDPNKKLEDDPFLKILGELKPDKVTYARLIWKEWAANEYPQNVLKLESEIRQQTSPWTDEIFDRARGAIRASWKYRGRDLDPAELEFK